MGLRIVRDVRSGFDGPRRGGGGWRTVVSLPSFATASKQTAVGVAGVDDFCVFPFCVYRTVNGKYAQSIKEALRKAGGVGFTYPPCWADGYVEGEEYLGGQRVSYDG